MKMSNTWAKALPFVAALAAAALLTACGGGGSPATTPDPVVVTPASISLSKTPSANGVDIASPVSVDAKLASSFTTSGDVGTVTTVVKGFACDGTPVTVTAAVTSGKVSYTNGALPSGASCTLSVKLTGSTASADGSLPSGEASYAFTTVAAPKVFRYTNLVLTVFADGTLGRIIPDATAAAGYRSLALVNKTVYTTGAFHPLALCATVWDGLVMHKEKDGSPTVSCVTPAVGNLRRYFAVNPDTNEIGVEVSEPAGVVLRDVGGSGSLYEAQGIAYTSMYTSFGGFLIYVLNTDMMNLRAAPINKAGVVDFSKSVIIDDSNGHQGYQFFGSVSN